MRLGGGDGRGVGGILGWGGDVLRKLMALMGGWGVGGFDRE